MQFLPRGGKWQLHVIELILFINTEYVMLFNINLKNSYLQYIS
jgi:hypothetical protein